MWTQIEKLIGWRLVSLISTFPRLQWEQVVFEISESTVLVGHRQFNQLSSVNYSLAARENPRYGPRWQPGLTKQK